MSSPSIKTRPFTSALPIPTLPVSSATAAHSAHIASLTSQVEELVNKNRNLTVKYEDAVREWEIRVHAERDRGEGAVRAIKEGNGREVGAWRDNLETIQLSAKHNSMMMAYAHDMTKRNNASLETDLELRTQELKTAVLQLKLVQTREKQLRWRFEDSEQQYQKQIAEVLAKYEEAQLALVTSQTKISAVEGKQLAKLKNELTTTLATLSQTESSLEGTRSKFEELQASYERLSLELKDERRERKEMEREGREIKDQLANWKRLEGKEADTNKESKKRVRELEVSLAAEQSRVTDLGSRVEELEGESKQLEKSLKRAEKEKGKLEDLVERLQGEKETLEKGLEKVTKKGTKDVKKAHVESEKENEPGVAKSKKRVRDEDEEEERVSKKAKPEPKGKTKEKPLKASMKPKSQGVYEPAPITWSPADHLPNEDSEEEFSPPIMQAKPQPVISSKPPAASTSSKPAATTSTSTNTSTAKPAAKWKRPDPSKKSTVPSGLKAIYDESEEEGDKWIFKGAYASPEQPAVAAGKSKGKAVEKEVKEKKAKKVKVVEEPEEYFDVNAVSSTEEEDDEVVVVKTEPVKKKTVEKAKAEVTKKKPAADTTKKSTETKKPAELAKKSETSRKPSGSQPSQSQSTENGGLGPKPKKKGFNLLAGVSGGGGLGLGDNWMGR